MAGAQPDQVQLGHTLLDALVRLYYALELLRSYLAAWDVRQGRTPRAAPGGAVEADETRPPCVLQDVR